MGVGVDGPAMEPDSFFHVAVKTNDIERSVSFYREYFEGTVVERGDAADGEGATAVTYAALEVADKLVYVFDRAPYEAAGLVDDLPTGFLHFGFVVGDVDAASQELAADGISFIMEPTRFGSLNVSFFEAPSGVRIELIEHVEE